MSSQNKDLLSDIRTLLDIDTLTPEMERVISVVRAYRPYVDIDKKYQQRLKQQLINPSSSKAIPTRLSWPTWINWVGTSLAALVVTLGVIQILFPERHAERGEYHLTTATPNNQDQPLVDRITPPIIPIQDTQPIVTKIEDSVISRMNNTPIQVLGDSGILSIGSTAMHTPQIDIPQSDTISGLPMAMPEVGIHTKTVTAIPTISDVSMDDPISNEIDTEIQDMIWEINSIINQSDSIVVPQFPTEMPIYYKSGAFTPEEELLNIGTGITSIIIPTYPPIELESIIRQKVGSKEFVGTPVVRYIQHNHPNQSLLIPTIIYTTHQAETIMIPIVVGY